MRIQLGSPPAAENPAIDADPGRSIRQPGRWMSAILATLAGLFLLAVPVAVSIAYSVLLPEAAGDPIPRGAIPWGGMLITLLLGIIAHEFLHAVLHPDFGLSDSSVLFVGWTKLQFGVYYEGRFPRGRWVAMRLLPLFVLTVLPLGVFLSLGGRMTFALETYLIILMLTNSLGSGGDLVAAMIVLRQVPAGGELNFHRGRAYWLPAVQGNPEVMARRDV